MTDRELLRHTIAALAYRAAKPMRGAPDSFAEFKASPTSKTPLQIIAHMGDLFDWSLTLLDGAPVWKNATPTTWDQERERFFKALEKFDHELASGRESKTPLGKLFQAPIADALTHVGQLAMLRRLHGHPIKGESYFRADITIGRAGFEQTPPNPQYEFD